MAGMTENEAVAYIENYGWSTTRLGLARTRELLAKLGNPQKRLRFIHVAGSNGKGSACAMFDAILSAAGYQTGLYTSPYIEEFSERIRVDGENIPGEALAKITERVKAIADAMADHPSQFELVTAIGMVYFLERDCDVVVLEVGMGGALDSTNAIDAPELAVIANIGLEHTEYLGDTLEKIAATKAGIIKPGCACVCYDGAPEVTHVLRDVCAEKGVRLTRVDYANLKPLAQSLEGQDFAWKGQPYRLNLIGEHQLHNAALVLTGVEALRARGWNIPDAAVLGGLQTVTWPARLEVLNRSPLLPVVPRQSVLRPGLRVSMFEDEELIGGKVKAFFDRVKVRDLYDIANLGRLVERTPEEEMALAHAVMLYYASLSASFPHGFDSRPQRFEGLHGDLEEQLFPMLRRNVEAPSLEELLVAAREFVERHVLPRSDAEREYLERFAVGDFAPSLLFGDEAMVEAALSSPEAQWKLQNLKRMPH